MQIQRHLLDGIEELQICWVIQESKEQQCLEGVVVFGLAELALIQALMTRTVTRTTVGTAATAVHGDLCAKTRISQLRSQQIDHSL